MAFLIFFEAYGLSNDLYVIVLDSLKSLLESLSASSARSEKFVTKLQHQAETYNILRLSSLFSIFPVDRPDLNLMQLADVLCVLEIKASIFPLPTLSRDSSKLNIPPALYETCQKYESVMLNVARKETEPV
jgi:hypothetical protein